MGQKSQVQKQNDQQAKGVKQYWERCRHKWGSEGDPPHILIRPMGTDVEEASHGRPLEGQTPGGMKGQEYVGSHGHVKGTITLPLTQAHAESKENMTPGA